LEDLFIDGVCRAEVIRPPGNQTCFECVLWRGIIVMMRVVKSTLQ